MEIEKVKIFVSRSTSLETMKVVSGVSVKPRNVYHHAITKFAADCCGALLGQRHVDMFRKDMKHMR